MNDVAADQSIVQGSAEVEQLHERNHTPDKGLVTGNPNLHNTHNRHDSPGRTLRHSVTSHWTEADEASILPTRWWYAQTAFPLCAGTFGPMANAFSICALVENWRIEIPPNGKEADGMGIKDPKWLITVNAISLACALIANMSLLLNMARRLSFSVAQSITIVGFWVSSILLIGLIARASHDFRASGVSNQALTQAYYYACWAAGLYQIISYLMCVTVYGALRGKYDRDFKLTTAQRTLMLQTISFLAYLLVGALVFSHIEGWKFLDAVYWADFTLLTVGIGDYAPATHTGRSLLFPFAIGGIVVLGLVVSSIRSLILDRGKAKHSARMTEKIRRKVVQEIDLLREGKKSFHYRQRQGVTPEIAKQIAVGPSNSAKDELERRRAEFIAMRKVQDFSERRQKWMNLLVSTSAWAMLWFLGALIFAYTERNEQQWSYFVSVYFAYTSLLTIGYGDLSPTSDSGKAFFVFWSLLAVPSLTIVISDMSDTVVRFIKDATIWLGEVTILPSSEGTVRDSLERGLSKMTLHMSNKIFQPTGGVNTDTSEESNNTGLKLGKLYESSRKRLSMVDNKDQTDRVARDFEEVEKAEENKAHHRNEPIAEDEHRYRRTLISVIRQLYSDSHLGTPKKYTYDEWAYFLKLLGQDERSSEFHRLAPLKRSVKPGEQQNRWSWIGPRSPLMANRHESALLLEMFFERLEENLSEGKQNTKVSSGAIGN